MVKLKCINGGERSIKKVKLSLVCEKSCVQTISSEEFYLYIYSLIIKFENQLNIELSILYKIRV